MKKWIVSWTAQADGDLEFEAETETEACKFFWAGVRLSENPHGLDFEIATVTEVKEKTDDRNG